MKKLFIFILPLLALWSCEEKVTETVTYKINEPVKMSVSDFRNSVKISKVPQSISGQGKMCFYNGYLYMSEPGKGIHIINNQNPAQPVVAGFIELLGNADLAIRDNKLYADSYVDLVYFDVTDPANPVLKGRLNKVFPDVLPVILNNVSIDYAMCYNATQNDSVVVGWKEVERTEPYDHYTGGWFWRGGWIMGGMVDDVMTTGTKEGSTTGLNGSMSRFTINNDMMYCVMNSQMTIFDLTPDTPYKAIDNFYVGWNVETIFSYKTNLFMGTPTGMIIYSVADPKKPVYMSSISHVFGCDPVVVEDDLAYVTVRSGNLCGQNANELNIYDVKDVKAPKIVATYAMVGPKGLGIDNKKLFLCDDGLKIFKADDPQTIIANLIKHYKGMDGYDVIPYNNVLMMVAADGIYQYDYTNLDDIKLLSKLPFSVQ